MIFNLDQKKNIKGFTLVEMMIATTLFSIVMLMGVGSLVVSSNASKAAQKLRIAVDNVNFAMESMTRELRMGTRYYCGGDMNLGDVQDCTSQNSPGDIITFNTQAGKRVGYYREGRGDGTYTLKRCIDDTSHCSPIVSSDVNVKQLSFFVMGSDYSITDKVQPSVVILMEVAVKVKNDTTNFFVQTIASQRSAEK